MDADLDALSIRFRERDKTNERHPGLVMPATFKGFTSEGVERFRDFYVGDRIVVETTDFTTFDYAKIDNDIANFTSGKMIREG